MTTGATGQLGLALPVQGELSGTWGDTVNNGITQYTNIAIAGTLTLTGDGAVTLANTTGDASASNITSTLTGAGTVTAQFAIVRVTGTLTVAKVVTGPSYSKTYTVVNAATGGIVTFKASGQTGVSVAVGESAFVYFNGTDYVKVSGTVAVASFQTSLGGLTPSTATTGVVTLAGTLNTTSGGTGLTSFTAGDVPYYASGSVLSKLAIGTAGQFLTSSGTAPQWSTLSGVAVTTFSAGTTGFTPSSATSGAVTLAGTLATTNGGTGLTSFTSGGVVYASSTSALATGSALTFDGTNLGIGTAPSAWATISPVLQLGGAGGYIAAQGSAEVLRIGSNNYFAGGFKYVINGFASRYDQAEGVHSWYSAASGTAGNAVTFTEGMRLTSTGLGIGTSSPGSKLQTSTARSATVVSAIFSETGTGAVADVNKITLSVQNTLGGATGGAGIGAVLEASASNQTGLAFYYDGGSGSQTEGLRLSSAGNLGLGVTPSAWFATSRVLQVGSGGAIEGRSNFEPYISTTSNAYLDTAGTYKYIATAEAGRYLQDSGAHKFYTAPSGTAGNAISFTQAMTLSAAGNLLVGLTSASLGSRFEVKSSNSSLVGFISSDANGTAYEARASAGKVSHYATYATSAIDCYHAWFTTTSAGAQSQAMTLETSGNLGVGTTSPSFRLHAVSSAAVVSRIGSSGGSGAFINFIDSGASPSVAPSVGAIGNSLVFMGDTSSSERARIDSSGNLLVGKTSGGGAVGPRVEVDNTNNTSGDSGLFVYLGGNCSNTSSSAFSALISGVGNKFYVYGNGNVVNTNNSYGAISDVKFKENIVDATPKLDDVLNLKVRNFNLKTEPNNKQIGFIAQEFEEVFPSMIDVSPDTDVNGKTLETTHKSIKLSVLVPILVKAMQEQQALIQSLKARLDAANL